MSASENDNAVLGTDHDHNVGTPSSFGKKGSKKKNQASIEMCLFGTKKCQNSLSSSDTNLSPPTLNENHTIDLLNLRRLASQGIPDNGCYRSIVWRVLLGYLPCEVKDWESVLKKERTFYNQLVEELFNTVIENHDVKNYYEAYPESEETNNKVKIENETVLGDKETPDITSILEQTKIEEPSDETRNLDVINVVDESINKDATQNTQSNGSFNQNLPGTPCTQKPFKESETESINDQPDNADNIPVKFITSCNGTYNDEEELDENVVLLEEIRKDVVRTHPSFHFFLEPEENLGQQRYAAIERILFVWAKLNNGVRYVQGMNEIVGTIFFVLATDSNGEWAEEAEADAYFLFNTLMSEMRDVFVPDLDDADTGIQGRISNFVTLLSLHDPEVKCHMDDIGIDATFFCIRWLTTLLSREFMLPDTIRIWDSMFSATHKDNFLRYVCVTMIMVIRAKLLQSDFSQCLRLLQSYPPTNIDRLLESSRALWIYESQVTLACYKGGIRLQHALKSLVPPPAIIMAYGLSGGVAQPKSSSSYSQSFLPIARKTARSYLNGTSKSLDNQNVSCDNTNNKEGSAASRKKFFGSTAKSFFSQVSNYISETNNLVEKASEHTKSEHSS